MRTISSIIILFFGLCYGNDVSYFTVYNRGTGNQPSGYRVISFDAVREGYGFDLATNSYTCQYSGLYMFSATVRQIGSQTDTWYSIRLGETRMVEQSINARDYPTSTFSATFWCNAGERVTARTDRVDGSHLTYIADEGTIFSGLYLGLTPPTYPSFAFTASLGWDTGIYPYNIVVFNNERNSYGRGAYNPVTGAFTCPQNGVYRFSVTLQHSGLHNCQYQLQKNGARLAHLLLRSLDQSMTSVVFAACSVGNTVNVMCIAGSNCTLRGSSTTFTGALMIDF